jgi:hypothetical protein
MIEDTYEFSNDTQNGSSEYIIKFKIYERYSDSIAIFERCPDEVQQMGINSLTPRHRWSVRWIPSGGNNTRSRYFTSPIAAKICASEMMQEKK